MMRNNMSYHFLCSALLSLLMITDASAEMWSLAVSKHRSDDRVIIFRYISEFAPNFDRAAKPARIILVWKYASDKGMPSTAEQARMNDLENLLQPVIESDDRANLVLVSTGNNLREWTYYAKSEKQFISAINQALAGKPPFPIEIHSAADPQWSSYETLIKKVK
ncbi:DUF695 domain-containing protein [Collimonas humicola]|uniref:DUF695 domain-containing protein n=1 Tax=Collimonas humicola TaxID=2825886 RepID=UPI001B8C6B05|nr:DUF695 domain-containing protein [Collimonas humicola]